MHANKPRTWPCKAAGMRSYAAFKKLRLAGILSHG